MTAVRPARDSELWPTWMHTAGTLFRAGFVPTQLPPTAGIAGDGVVFMRSSRLAAVTLAGTASSDLVTMSRLGHYGRFGNQLFQYAFLKLYSLYTASALAVPAWEGEALFGLSDPRPGPLPPPPPLRFLPFDDDDLALWDVDNPPVNVDFLGYFQEVPAAWLPHRTFLRRLFTLVDELRRPLQAAVDRLRDDGRTLVAIHVRRGDYLTADPVRQPWFRCVPLDWYRDWLAARWPGLARPVLYVASDDPAAAAAFADFGPLALDDPALASIPAHIRDFFLLTSADVLALCNSSFSRMAALLAEPAQRCFLPSFGTADQAPGFAPYDPWADRAFWSRFGPSGGNGLAGSGLDASRRRGLFFRQAAGLLGRRNLTDEDRERLLAELFRSAHL